MKIKAVFFLFIFMLNTLVGFGCSITMKNEGNEHSLRHHHTHQPETVKQLLSQHASFKINGEEDSCCKTLVNDFLVQGKLLPDYAKLNLKAPALDPFGFRLTLIPEINIVIADQQGIDLYRYRPPHPDIRISIQSFQI
ncbi:hypothetical protein [Pedobacter miscanthi]|uniref:Uncharacterized protein n=1 Tax=Pedobacter miscanthi TaxID=2259170 RepID=A0A366KVG9_9SPHI|nr:hypothetical protein [Pedobacter miscanthi]RBQ05520.1 hypothetical protein DRW42_16170 [Pedobacter miscanthi]